MIVLVTKNKQTLGLLVDDVNKIEQIRVDSLSPPLNQNAGINHTRALIQGTTASLISLINLDTLFSDPMLVIQDKLD